jgi:hypothetical protein
MIERIKSMWRYVRENADKLIPNRAARWAFIWIPLFTAAGWFGIKVIMGGTEAAADVQAYLASTAPVSVRVMVAVFFTYLLMCAFGWNLDNRYREDLQRVLDGSREGNVLGAFLILAGEPIVAISLLILFMRAVILWPMAIPQL